MKRVRILYNAYSFLILCLTFLPVTVAADSNSIIVYGIGYPPIKSQSKAQALLMARRAAILDAYRNALKRSTGELSEAYDDKTFYEHFSGFIKGMKITSEEYVSDGGVMIKASISLHDISVLQKGYYIKEKEDLFEKKEGPQSVTVEEWYKIISDMVRFENKVQ